MVETNTRSLVIIELVTYLAKDLRLSVDTNRTEKLIDTGFTTHARITVIHRVTDHGFSSLWAVSVESACFET